MKDYYHYFVNKGNHPNKNNILNKKNYYSNCNGRDYSNMDWSKLYANSNF